MAWQLSTTCGKRPCLLLLCMIFCNSHATRDEDTVRSVFKHEPHQQTSHFVVTDLEDRTEHDESCQGMTVSERWQIVAVGLGDQTEEWKQDFFPPAFEHWLETVLIQAHAEGVSTVDLVLVSPLVRDPVEFCTEATRMRYLSAMYYKDGWAKVMQEAANGAMRLQCVNAGLPEGNDTKKTNVYRYQRNDFAGKKLGDLRAITQSAPKDSKAQALVSFHAILSASDAALTPTTSFTDLWTLVNAALPETTQTKQARLVWGLARAAWNSLCSKGRFFFYNEWLWATTDPNQGGQRRLALADEMMDVKHFVEGAHFEAGNAYLADMLVALTLRFPEKVNYVVGGIENFNFAVKSRIGRYPLQYMLDPRYEVEDFLKSVPHEIDWKQNSAATLLVGAGQATRARRMGGAMNWVMTPYNWHIEPEEALNNGTFARKLLYELSDINNKLQKRKPLNKETKQSMTPIDFYALACGIHGNVCKAWFATEAPSCKDYFQKVQDMLSVQEMKDFIQQSGANNAALKRDEVYKDDLGGYYWKTGLTWHMIKVLLQAKFFWKLTPITSVSIEAESSPPCS